MAFLLIVLPRAACSQAPLSVHTAYEAFAAGLPIAAVQAGFESAATTYSIDMTFRTTGVAGLFLKGRQQDRSEGIWQGNTALPSRFVGTGHWNGRDRLAVLVYRGGNPVVETLVPPNAEEREEVPEEVRAGSIDTMSALAQMVRVVNATGRCDTSAPTFDGRRRSDIRAWTAGEEDLPPTGRSAFHGKALRCDFEGVLIAGFKLGEHHDPKVRRTRRGSAWFARVAGTSALLPVRLSFESDWFHEVVLYLTSAAGPDIATAR
jgi:hypothetical protein